MLIGSKLRYRGCSSWSDPQKRWLKGNWRTD
jgi:hypothetical protein